MSPKYSSIDVYFHMKNHYRKLRTVNGVIDTSPPKGYPELLLKRGRTVTKDHKKFPAKSESYNVISGRFIKKHDCLSSHEKIPYSVRSVSLSPARPPTRRNPSDMPLHNQYVSTRAQSTGPQVKFASKQKEAKKPRSGRLKYTSSPVRNASPFLQQVVSPTPLIEVGQKPVPAPRSKKKVSRAKFAAKEHEYLQFLLRITEDIIRNDLYNNKEMRRVFKSHIEANRGRLDETIMNEKIDNLCKELNIPVEGSDDVNELEDGKFYKCDEPSVILQDYDYSSFRSNMLHDTEEKFGIRSSFNDKKNCICAIQSVASLGKVTEHTEPSTSHETINTEYTNGAYRNESTTTFSEVDADILPGFENLENVGCNSCARVNFMKLCMSDVPYKGSKKHEDDQDTVGTLKESNFTDTKSECIRYSDLAQRSHDLEKSKTVPLCAPYSNIRLHAQSIGEIEYVLVPGSLYVQKSLIDCRNDVKVQPVLSVTSAKCSVVKAAAESTCTAAKSTESCDMDYILPRAFLYAVNAPARTLENFESPHRNKLEENRGPLSSCLCGSIQKTTVAVTYKPSFPYASCLCRKNIDEISTEKLGDNSELHAAVREENGDKTTTDVLNLNESTLLLNTDYDLTPERDETSELGDKYHYLLVDACTSTSQGTLLSADYSIEQASEFQDCNETVANCDACICSKHCFMPDKHGLKQDTSVVERKLECNETVANCNASDDCIACICSKHRFSTEVIKEENLVGPNLIADSNYEIKQGKSLELNIDKYAISSAFYKTLGTQTTSMDDYITEPTVVYRIEERNYTSNENIGSECSRTENCIESNILQKLDVVPSFSLTPSMEKQIVQVTSYLERFRRVEDDVKKPGEDIEETEKQIGAVTSNSTQLEKEMDTVINNSKDAEDLLKPVPLRLLDSEDILGNSYSDSESSVEIQTRCCGLRKVKVSHRAVSDIEQKVLNISIVPESELYAEAGDERKSIRFDTQHGKLLESVQTIDASSFGTNPFVTKMGSISSFDTVSVEQTLELNPVKDPNFNLVHSRPSMSVEPMSDEEFKKLAMSMSSMSGSYNSLGSATLEDVDTRRSSTLKSRLNHLVTDGKNSMKTFGAESDDVDS